MNLSQILIPAVIFTAVVISALILCPWPRRHEDDHDK